MTTIVDKFEMIHRLKKLEDKLKELNLDAFLVSNFYNIYYLSGFKTLTINEREAWLLITKKNNYLFTDARYVNQTPSTQQILFKLISPEKNLLQHFKEITQEERIAKLGFEADDLKFSEYQKIKEKFTNVQFVPAGKLIIKLREIKNDDEIEKIKKACQITDQCLTEIIKTIKIGQTEKEIAFKIEFWLKKHGYDLAFYPIVAIDKNSALPHYDTKTNGHQQVKQSSIILVDFGAKYQDYISDITRMIFIGKPTNEQLSIYDVLLNAQQKTIEELRKTNDPKKIDQFCRTLINQFQPILTNFNEFQLTYPHSTGHGLGLEIHEYPKISQTSTNTIQKNQVFTIEPGIYLQGKFGIRIEDTVWMKADNETAVLTKFPKTVIAQSL